jgi:cation-transporting ATPase 13A1
MIFDFAGCWLVEIVCKYCLADLEPKEMISRGRERRQERRKAERKSSQVVEH